jgi:hypothetical protein
MDVKFVEHTRAKQSRRVALLLFMWAGGLAPRPATAQPPGLKTSPSARADIVLLGPAPATAAVKDVAAELLARQHVDVAWAVQGIFRPQDIFAPDAGNSGAAIAVWIDLLAATEARLYFRDFRTDRFFLRSVPLVRGIDEMAKEEIAHIVANAVSALSSGLGETLTRTEARVALHMRREPELGSAEIPSPSPWRSSVALLVGARSFADEPRLAADAAGVLALVHRLPGRWSSALGGWASLGHQFAADYRGSVVGATVQSTGLRAGVLGTVELSRRVVLGLATGAGVERILYAPQAVREEVVVAPADAFYVPAVSVWCGLDFRLVGGLALTVHVSSDVLLEQVRFDLHDSGGHVSHVLEPYSFRPGASLGLAYAF